MVEVEEVEELLSITRPTTLHGRNKPLEASKDMKKVERVLYLLNQQCRPMEV